MKTLYSLTALALVAIISGCATSSQVQEAIDANHQDFLAKIESHEASIEVLKKSAMTGLEKGQENSELLTTQQAQLDEILNELKIIRGFAEASKVMSAANTVKLASLDEQLQANDEADAENIERLMTIDKLYEEVMISHYQMIADSANEAIEQLKSMGWNASTNAPVDLNEPIEIVAPDTTAPAATNTPAEEAPVNE